MRHIPNMKLTSCFGLVAGSLWLMTAVVQGQTAVSSTTLNYQVPPKAISDLIDAPPTPAISLSPKRDRMIIMQRTNLPNIREVAQDELKLAGMRLNPKTNGLSQFYFYTGLTLKNVNGEDQRSVQGLPANARISNVRWSPDGQKIAFTLTHDDRIELWAADVSKEEVTAKKLSGKYRMNTANGGHRWLSNNATLVFRIVPEARGAAPAKPNVPCGPNVQENIGKKAPARTYQDLLANEHDAALFDHYLTCRIARVDLSGKITVSPREGIITRVSPSPDAQYILTETIKRPYSYIVPMSRFPKVVEVWDMKGNRVRLIADLPLAEDIPTAFGSARTGPRSVSWRADKPAALYWTEAQDGGDPRREAKVRDRVFTLAAPFDKQPHKLVSLSLRYNGITWGNDQLAMVSEWWWRNRKIRTWLMNPSSPSSEPTVLWDRSWEDRYNDPGVPMLRDLPNGRSVLLTDDSAGSIFLSGIGASPEGNRPFVDRLDLASKETERLWRSASPYYESAVSMLDLDQLKIMTRRESKTEPPNYFIRDLRGETLKQVTDFPHPMPQMKDVNKEMIHYKRADGVKLTATLYLPPGKTANDGPFPMLMWAYPQEFKNADHAGQVTDSPYRFVRTSSRSPLLWLVHGYAVLDDPSLPIVGEGDEEPNDTYVEQLVNGAQAAVDEVVRRGVADRDRIAIGGHSYGAFMTANLLAHSDLFRAGIARSGAYNRTLTPFGFQAEERTFWEAPHTYFTMSPFMHAERINEPILLIHGEEDNNSGTFPIQSKRYYHALKGHGATVRLVMLPEESHGYRARESVMHMAWEMTKWLDQYVKNVSPQQAEIEKR